MVSPCLPTGSFLSKKIDVTYALDDGNNPDDEYYTCVLPDDVLVELLADRLQVNILFYNHVKISFAIFYKRRIISIYDINEKIAFPTK